MSIKKWFW